MDLPVCRHLRTKILYSPGQAADAESEAAGFEPEVARHCWCNKTMTPVGLDDRPVGLELCSQATRKCYVSQ